MGDNSGRTVKRSSLRSRRDDEWMDEGGGFKAEGGGSTDGTGVGTKADAVLGRVLAEVVVVEFVRGSGEVVVVLVVVKVVGRLEVVVGRVGVVVLVVGVQVRGVVVVDVAVVGVVAVSLLAIAVGGQV